MPNSFDTGQVGSYLMGKRTVEIANPLNIDILSSTRPDGDESFIIIPANRTIIIEFECNNQSIFQQVKFWLNPNSDPEIVLSRGRIGLYYTIQTSSIGEDRELLFELYESTDGGDSWIRTRVGWQSPTAEKKLAMGYGGFVSFDYSRPSSLRPGQGYGTILLKDVYVEKLNDPNATDEIEVYTESRPADDKIMPLRKNYSLKLKLGENIFLRPLTLYDGRIGESLKLFVAITEDDALPVIGGSYNPDHLGSFEVRLWNLVEDSGQLSAQILPLRNCIKEPANLTAILIGSNAKYYLHLSAFGP